MKYCGSHWPERQRRRRRCATLAHISWAVRDLGGTVDGLPGAGRVGASVAPEAVVAQLAHIGAVGIGPSLAQAAAGG